MARVVRTTVHGTSKTSSRKKSTGVTKSGSVGMHGTTRDALSGTTVPDPWKHKAQAKGQGSMRRGSTKI